MERKLIRKWRTNSRQYGYNLTSGGEGISAFREFTEAELERRRRYMFNRTVSSETRERMSLAKKGVFPWNKGRVMDEAYGQHISATHGQSKRIRCNGKLFANITECANHIGIKEKRCQNG